MFKLFQRPDKKGSQEKSPQKLLLSVTFDDKEILTVDEGHVPFERGVVLELASPHPLLTLTDSAGGSHRHDLSELKPLGKFLHLNLRLSERFAAEFDGLLSDSATSSQAKDEFAAHGPAARFQPFYLPECAADPAALVGKGFFYRGLHFQGVITPSNIKLACRCDQCRKSFMLSPFHAGFMDVAYFFCDAGTHTLMTQHPDAPGLLIAPDPDKLASLEAELPPCEKCGGHFAYFNPLLCPHCRAPYIDFKRFPQLREVEYYGATLLGENCQYWEMR